MAPAENIFPRPDRWDGAGCWGSSAEGSGLQHSWRNPPCLPQLRLRFLSPQRLGGCCQTCDLQQQQEGSGCGSRCSPGSTDLILLECDKFNSKFFLCLKTNITFVSPRVMGLLLFLKRSLACSPSQCIVGKTFPSASNRATWTSAWTTGWKTRSTSPQACQHLTIKLKVSTFKN